ncbi:MAG: porin [Bacteroidia bacterium]|nr:porin [Bacteroidia bacterium]MDW8348435.1 porin [Bacteroidia bacterium]
MSLTHRGTYYKIWLFFTLLFLEMDAVIAQKDSTEKLCLDTYVELYYSYDFSRSNHNTRPWFLCSYHRHNEVNLNLGLIRTTYKTKRVHTRLGLMAGTYPNVNLAHEEGLLKNIFEASTAVKILSHKEIWIDTGILPSHIGFESAIGKECWTLTRSILADNTPYYESGVRLSYCTNNQKWIMRILYLNGWQRIQRIPGNSFPAFGHQVTYSPKADFSINSSSFIGNIEPDSLKKMRCFHNFYTQIQLSQKVGLIVGFDIGLQQRYQRSNEYYQWYSWACIMRYMTSVRSFTTLRLEYYSDPKQVIINTQTLNGFQTLGYSLNFDYSISKNTLFRIEVRGFQSKDPVFFYQQKPIHTNYSITTSMAVSI